MPTVGKKEFPYTPTGIAAAKAYAAKTGQKLTTDPSQMPGGAKGRTSAQDLARMDLNESPRERRMETAPPKRGKRK